MAISDSMDLVLRLKFEAAIQDHVAKKATSRLAKAAAKRRAGELRLEADAVERLRNRGLDARS